MTPNTKPNGHYAQQRSAPRFAMALDIEWQPQAAQPPRPIQGRTRDISVRGFYFFSPMQQPLGTRLQFSVPFAFDHAGEMRPILKGIGSVVRCEELDASQKQAPFGIAVKIDEVIP